MKTLVLMLTLATCAAAAQTTTPAYVNRAGGSMTGALTAPAVNNTYIAGSGVQYSSVSAALAAAVAQGHSTVFNALGTFGATFTNSSNVPIVYPDLAHYYAGSVFPEEWQGKGDNTNNDGPAINSCIAYSGTFHVKCVALPNTAYKVTTSITMTNHAWFSGSGGVNGTKITCEVTPCVTIAKTGPLQGLHLSDLSFTVDPGISNSVGIDISSDQGTGTFLEESYIGQVTITGCAGQCFKSYGSTTVGGAPAQFDDFEDFNIQGPTQMHSLPLVDFQNYQGQNVYKNFLVNGDTAGSTNYPVLWNLSYTGGTNSTTLLFLNDTIQNGIIGLNIQNCTGCVVHSMNIEQVAQPFVVQQSRYFDLDDVNIQNTISSWGPVIADLGANTGSIRNVTPSFTGTLSAYMTCNQSSVTSAWEFEGASGNSTYSPTTSNCLSANYVTASTVTLYTPTAVFAGDNGATPVETINSLQSPGTILTIQASGAGWVALGSSGNINLGTQPSPVMIPPSASVSLVAKDTAGNNKFLLLDSRPQGSAAQGDTVAGNGTFPVAVGANKACMAARYWTGTGTVGTTSATYNFSAFCPQAPGTAPLVYYAGPSALNATLSWTSMGNVVTTTAGTASLAAALSASSLLPGGTTAITQAPADNSTDVATDAFVLANGANAGVSSFTGDGTVLGNTASTGAVTATLKNAAQNSVLAGPLSGGAGAPTYQTAPSFSATNLIGFPTLNQNTTGTAAGLSGTQSANYFYAAPNGGTGAGAWRAMVSADVPTLNQNTTGTAAGLSTVLTYLISPPGGSSVAVNGANAIRAWGFYVGDAAISFSTINGISNTADGVNLYSLLITNSSGGIVCHPTTGTNIPTTLTIWTNTCSEGTVTLAANTVYVLMFDGAATTGKIQSASASQGLVPYYNGAQSGCTSALGVVTGTCTVSLSVAVAATGVPVFLLH